MGNIVIISLEVITEVIKKRTGPVIKLLTSDHLYGNFLEADRNLSNNVVLGKDSTVYFVWIKKERFDTDNILIIVEVTYPVLKININ